MPFVPTANVAHIQIIGEVDAQEEIVDLNFVSTAPPITALSLAALLAALASWWTDAIVPFLNEGYTVSHLRGRDLTSQFSFVATNADTTGDTGGITGEGAPNNVSANVTFGTGLAGRNNHGSNRIPAVSNSIVDTNTLDTTWLQNLLTGYGQLIAPSAVLPGGWTWVVLSQFSGSTIVDGKKVPTPRVAGVFHEIFDVYFTDNIVDSQKSRLPKHGR
jgi:hypothetical protein